jgi:hypothetical protein
MTKLERAAAEDVPAAGKATPLTAVTVMKDGTSYLMCPFFGKCDGALIIDVPKARVVFAANSERTAEALCSAIIAAGASRLICGFVPDAERDKLRAAGVDVRLGSCACVVEALVMDFDTLPKA